MSQHDSQKCPLLCAICAASDNGFIDESMFRTVCQSGQLFPQGSPMYPAHRHSQTNRHTDHMTSVMCLTLIVIIAQSQRQHTHTSTFTATFSFAQAAFLYKNHTMTATVCYLVLTDACRCNKWLTMQHITVHFDSLKTLSGTRIQYAPPPSMAPFVEMAQMLRIVKYRMK